MSNHSKVKEVLERRELLRINSLHKQLSKEKRKRYFCLITTLFVCSVAVSIWLPRWEGSPPIFVLPIIFTGLYFFMLLCFYHLCKRGHPLIFTERGIALPFVAANFWTEIESYLWEDFKGWNKVPGPSLFSWVEGTSLRIVLQGTFSSLSSRWQDGNGDNILATHLIFFSSEQIAKAEAIFAEYGIRRRR